MVLHVSCAGLEASLESVASSPCASYKLYKCSVFPHCCPFYLLILADLLLSFDSLGEKEMAVVFCACAIFVELDIFVPELNIKSHFRLHPKQYPILTEQYALE